jgi:DNA-binding response OmpR family regulator
MTERMRALVLDSDLFFVTKITATLRHVGYETRTAREADAFARLLREVSPAIALVNLAGHGIDWRAAIVAARAAGVPIVAYAPHVDVRLHESARQAGADSVIAHSKLATDLPAVVARTVRRGAAGPDRDSASSSAFGSHDVAGRGDSAPDHTD